MDLQYNFLESLPYMLSRLASRGYFHGRAFGMGEWFKEDAYSVFEEGRVRFGLDGLLLPGHQGHIAVRHDCRENGVTCLRIDKPDADGKGHLAAGILKAERKSADLQVRFPDRAA